MTNMLLARSKYEIVWCKNLLWYIAISYALNWYKEQQVYFDHYVDRVLETLACYV